jgi:hypothetical protein
MDEGRIDKRKTNHHFAFGHRDPATLVRSQACSSDIRSGLRRPIAGVEAANFYTMRKTNCWIRTWGTRLK